jgi:hypothetical protein
MELAFRSSTSLLPDGRVLIAGGRLFNVLDAVPTLNLTSVEIWDPRSDTWTEASPMISARSSHSAALLKDGRVLVAGGISSGPPEIWDPASDQWMVTPPMKTGIGDAERMALLPDGRALVMSMMTDEIWSE